MRIRENQKINATSILLGVILTCLVIGGMLVLQYFRQAFPFSSLANTHIVTPPSEQELDNVHGRAAVTVSADWGSRIGLQTESVQREAITKTLRTVATVVPDEGRVSHVHTRVSGWIEKLYVQTTGETVRKGQALAAIFSQDLYASQLEYLAARSRAENSPFSVVVESARKRLLVLGMSENEIIQIEREGEPHRLVTTVAPHNGIVLRRAVAVGTAVDPSTELLTIADISVIWVIAEVPESDISLITKGMPVLVEFPSSGLATINARVDFLYPTLSERTRSLRVRIVIPNPNQQLPPGLSGIVQFQGAAREALTIPRDAVVDTGDMQHAFVLTPQKQYEPRPIRLGLKLANRVEVLEGLEEGEQIVTSGVFLIDSESRLRGSGAAGLSHGSHGSQSSPREENKKETTEHTEHKGH